MSTLPLKVRQIHEYATRQRLLKLLDGKPERTIANNTTILNTFGTVSVYLYGNYIAKFYVDSDGIEKVFVTDGGWRSVTTKQRLDQLLWYTDWTITQANFTWYACNVNTGDMVPFRNFGAVPVYGPTR